MTDFHAWTDVVIRRRKVSIYHDYPGHYYALDPRSGVVVNGASLEQVVALLRHPRRLRGLTADGGERGA